MLNPNKLNGLSHPYHSVESTSIFMGIRMCVSFFFHFSMKINLANRKASDRTPRFAASFLGLLCLPMSHKRTPGLYELNAHLTLTLVLTVNPLMSTFCSSLW